MLRAYGAEVVICPTAVEPDSPESYYSVSDRLAEEIPGGFKPDQYSNMSNPEAHYLHTGPEIWEQTGGEIDAIVISVGTGGTISGLGRYFKERKPEVLIVGADPEGSIYTAKRDGVITTRVIMIDFGRSHNHLRAKSAKRVDLLLAHLVGHREDAAVALDRRGQGEAHSGVA